MIEIKAPTVGTFYAQEKPGAPPYVVIGSRVTPTTVVGQIEAMKLFNEITAGCNGVIREILVDDKQPRRVRSGVVPGRSIGLKE